MPLNLSKSTPNMNKPQTLGQNKTLQNKIKADSVALKLQLAQRQKFAESTEPKHAREKIMLKHEGQMKTDKDKVLEQRMDQEVRAQELKQTA